MRPIYIGVSQESHGEIVTTQLRCGEKYFHRLKINVKIVLEHSNERTTKNATKIRFYTVFIL